MGIIVPQNVLVEHCYTIFECHYPTLDDWQKGEIKRYYKRLPDGIRETKKRKK